MTEYSISQTILQGEKERLGDLKELELKADTFAQAHELLGQEVGNQVRKMIKQTLDGMDSDDELKHNLETARMSRSLLQAKIKDQKIPLPVRQGMHEYLDCLSSWGKGAKLDTIDHPKLKNTFPDGKIDSDILAYMIQNDNQGCQTGMKKLKDGSVMVWHTEEDQEENPGDRFDQIRLAKFVVGKENPITRYSIIYPDLHPGAGFGFDKDFFYAVDFQFIKPNAVKNGTLANSAVWTAWRLGAETDPVTVLKSFAPIIDGYTLNCVRRITGSDGKPSIDAQKVEFGNNHLEEFRIGNPKDIFQTDKNEKISDTIISNNMFEPGHNASKDIEDDMGDYLRIHYSDRRSRAQRTLHLMSVLTKRESSHRDLLRMLAHRVGGIGKPDNPDTGSWAYSNVDVKAHVVGTFTPEATIISAASGPAVKNESVKEYRFLR